MKEKVIIGAGGAAKELKAHMNQRDIKCFVDDDFFESNQENIFKLSQFDPKNMEAIVAIGSSLQRSKIVKKLPKETKFFSFIHPSSLIMSDNIIIGEGSIISANCVLTTNINIGKHSYLNRSVMVGHDCMIRIFLPCS